MAYADDAILIAVVPYLDMRDAVADSLNHDLVALWCSGNMLASHARGPGFNPRAG